MREQTPQIRENTASALRASPVARASAGRWSETLKGAARIFGSAFAMALFLSLIGAFGTGSIPLGLRLFYWSLLMVSGSLVAVGVDRLMLGYLRHTLRLEGRPWLYGALLAVLLTPSISLVVWAITPLFGHMNWNIAHYVRFLGPVGVIATAMTALNVLINREPQQSHAFAPVAAPQTEAPQVAFLDRLPFKHQKADIYALSAEDHYLRVHTSAGNTLILMRLYDAIRELEGIEGSQTHRSWWVAKDAIEDVQKQDGKVCLLLRGDLEAPVSRTFQKILKSDGWI
ncbi:MAG: LytTR family DNA-binding domain-containing protein [Asticcacaulis sp.]